MFVCESSVVVPHRLFQWEHDHTKVEYRCGHVVQFVLVFVKPLDHGLFVLEIDGGWFVLLFVFYVVFVFHFMFMLYSSNSKIANVSNIISCLFSFSYEP